MTSSITKIKDSTVFAMVKAKRISDHPIFSEDASLKIKPRKRKAFYVLHGSFLDNIECRFAVCVHCPIHEI